MEAKELLRPRYKVIAAYPHMELDQHGVGDIISPYGMGFVYPEKVKEQYDSFPHLFKKLEWWEERAADELDWIEYLAWNEKSGKRYCFKLMKLNKETRIAEWNKQGYGPPLSDCEPITPEEYQSFINSQSISNGK